MGDRPRNRMPRAAWSGALAALLAATIATSGAMADDLDDRKSQLEQKIDTLESDLEFLDADIQETAAELKSYQARLPGAQQQLAEAQGRVQAATDEVNALAQRLDLAQQTRDQIEAQIAEDAAKLDDTRKIIGEIATQAYKRGGVSNNLTLLLEAGEDGDLADGIELANQALRSQNAMLDQLSQRHATDRNSQARLAAVEEEISGLKGQADSALAREQDARDVAEERKHQVDELIGQAQRLSDELAAKRPRIQARIAEQQAEHTRVLSDIKERQERLRREAEAKRQREEAAARKKWQAEQARQAAAAKAAKKTYVKKEYVAPARTSSGWGLSTPVAGGYITSGFGWRPTPAGTIDYGGAGGYVHAGLDWGFGGACGAPIHAAAAGEVWYAYRSGTSGNKVTVSHGVVNGHALATNYHHMSSYVVSPGQRVSKGQVIGYVGSTGNSTGCHLHFETVLDGAAVDPLGLL